jgi:hypothetical protein
VAAEQLEGDITVPDRGRQVSDGLDLFIELARLRHLFAIDPQGFRGAADADPQVMHGLRFNIGGGALHLRNKVVDPVRQSLHLT